MVVNAARSEAGGVVGRDGAGGGRRVLCPFCGASRVGGGEECSACGRADTEAARAAEVGRVGPWFVRDVGRPWRGGVTFGEVRRMIRVGEVSRGTVVRGPTTGQLWQYAAEVKGLSREFGLCHLCHEDIEPGTVNCPACGAGQVGAGDDSCLVERVGAGCDAVSDPVDDGHVAGPAVGRALTDMGGMGRVDEGASEARAEGANAILTAEQLQNAFRVPEGAAAAAGRGRRRGWGKVAAGVGVVVVLGAVVAGTAVRPGVGRGVGVWARGQMERAAHFLVTLRGE